MWWCECVLCVCVLVSLIQRVASAQSAPTLPLHETSPPPRRALSSFVGCSWAWRPWRGTDPESGDASTHPRKLLEKEVCEKGLQVAVRTYSWWRRGWSLDRCHQCSSALGWLLRQLDCRRCHALGLWCQCGTVWAWERGVCVFSKVVTRYKTPYLFDELNECLFIVFPLLAQFTCRWKLVAA